MLNLSIGDIKKTYNILKDSAKAAVVCRDYEYALQLIEKCDGLAEQFNWIYSDDELEDLLKAIADATIFRDENVFQPTANRVVFYDDFCVSFILVLQYLDALKDAGKEVIYITFQPRGERFEYILNRVARYPNVKMVILPRTSKVDDAQALYDEIVKYAPEQILLHMFACSPIAPTLFALPCSIKKYNINLADQTFWLGARAIDYLLEFRQFGVSVSQQRRGIKPEQQLLVPFYPIVDNNPFQGFPEKCTQQGKVLIFSGSDIYKVLDKKRMYWHLVKRLLDTFPEVVFLFATKGDGIGMDFLQKFIHENHYEGRFIYTKFRPDINEVLIHSDIFMGTCPAGGALMSQLAARNAIPILQYYYPETSDDATEQVICVNEDFQISFRDEESFMTEAEKLIHDVEYRKKQGERLQKAVISVEQFNEMVRRTLETNKTQIPLKPFGVDYKHLDERWFALEQAGYRDSFSYVWGLLKETGNVKIEKIPFIYLKKQLRVISNKIKQ